MDFDLSVTNSSNELMEEREEYKEVCRRKRGSAGRRERATDLFIKTLT